ncbi:HalD/BesD family halogenase [Pseudomonas soli]|uniref:HalD/BesD family halogenase n=1 Tax=Pseudomonas soli TaxID=1306993 RepID=UPI00345D3AF8
MEIAIDQASCNIAWEQLLSGRDIDFLKYTLATEGVVCLDGFLPEDFREELASEADALLATHGRRVNVLVQSTGNTPRKYVSVGRDDVFTHAPRIAGFYSDENLLRFLRLLANNSVIACPYEPEQIVVNRMDEVGDTHGWHWDDYTYSLVLVLEAPQAHSGAQVEYVDGTQWDKKSAKVEHYLNTLAVNSLKLQSGSAYVLLGKRVMHRVSPLMTKDLRKIICFSYAVEEERFTEIDHGSMENIYG